MKKQVIGLAWGLAACSQEVNFRSGGLDAVSARVVSDQEFNAARIVETSVTFQPLFGLVSEDLTLKEKPLLTRNLRQLERPLNRETYVQGNDGSVSTQEFEISSAGKVDLLLVIDNSGSMGEEQAQLSSNFKSLIKSLSAVDWQIGVITTDTCQLQNTKTPLRALRKGESGIEATFESTIKGLGTSGSRDEQGIKMAMQHLSGQCIGSPNTWLRANASLAVLFVSDEQNECFGDSTCADDLGKSWGSEDLINLMKSMRPIDQLKAYALLWNKDVNNKPSRNVLCRRDAGVETYGSMYSQVVDAFGGLEGSICLDDNATTNDYAPVLEQISSDVNRIIQREFVLDNDPVADSIVILVDGAPAKDVQVVGRKIILRNALASQIKVKVTYRHDAVPKFDRVRLKDLPSLETLDATVDGQSMDPTSLFYDEPTGELVFLEPPLDRQKVIVSYRSRLPLPKEFDAKQIILSAGPIVSIAVNGRINQNWTTTDGGAKIIFTDPPPDGSIVSLSYRPKDSKITTYAVPSSQDINIARSILAKDKFTGEGVDLKIENSQFLFDAQDVRDGRTLSIVYDYGQNLAGLSQQLAHDPIDDSVTLTTENSSKSCIDNIKINGKFITFDCGEDSIDDVSISYAYVEETFTSFQVSAPIQESDFLQVFIDGNLIQNFERKGQTIIPPKELLTINSKVRIVVFASDQARQ